MCAVPSPGPFYPAGAEYRCDCGRVWLFNSIVKRWYLDVKW